MSIYFQCTCTVSGVFFPDIRKQTNISTPLRLLRVGKRYHAFFIYHQQQLTWVKNIVNRLEEMHYICCYEDRDSVPGTPKAEMLITFIKQSTRVVVVLSEAFVNDRRCMYKVDQALDEFLDKESEYSAPTLVPITVDNCTIPRSLRVLSVCDVTRCNWWNNFVKSLEDDNLSIQRDASTTASKLESAAVELKEKLKDASEKEMELFLSKPIAFELSHFLSQHSKLTLFLSAMRTCGIEFNGDCMIIQLGTFKEFWNRNYNLSTCVKEHLSIFQRQIDKITLTFSSSTDMLDREDFQSMRDFNQLVQSILKTPSSSTWGLMWNMMGVSKDRSLRDVCRSLVHDAVTEKEILHIAHPEFACYERRLQTLSEWPKSKLPPKEAIARAGYYRENPVVFRCFYCNGVSWDFKPDEDPCARHAKWLFNCPYIKELKGAEFVNKCRFQLKRKTAMYNSSFKNSVDRLGTYGRWPMISFPKPCDLSDAGFYFTGTEDKVVCFACGYGLRNWTSRDDPWKRHAQWSPACDFLIQTLGKSFIQRVQSERDRTDTNNDCSITYVIQTRQLESF